VSGIIIAAFWEPPAEQAGGRKWEFQMEIPGEELGRHAGVFLDTQMRLLNLQRLAVSVGHYCDVAPSLHHWCAQSIASLSDIGGWVALEGMLVSTPWAVGSQSVPGFQGLYCHHKTTWTHFELGLISSSLNP
jgi:hypothetical protein